VTAHTETPELVATAGRSSREQACITREQWLAPLAQVGLTTGQEVAQLLSKVWAQDVFVKQVRMRCKGKSAAGSVVEG
jgi:hypothetical protein